MVCQNWPAEGAQVASATRRGEMQLKTIGTDHLNTASNDRYWAATTSVVSFLVFFTFPCLLPGFLSFPTSMWMFPSPFTSGKALAAATVTFPSPVWAVDRDRQFVCVDWRIDGNEVGSVPENMHAILGPALVGHLIAVTMKSSYKFPSLLLLDALGYLPIDNRG